MYPGVGTFVLIRPTQTFYERIKIAATLRSHCCAVREEAGNMSETTAHDAIAQALETLEEAKSEPTGGKWLERLTAQIAPYHQGMGHFPLLDMVRMA